MSESKNSLVSGSGPVSGVIPVCLLGATGVVGQKFICLLAAHPLFKLVAVCASNRSAGKKYRDAVNWKLAQPLPKHIGDLEVLECSPSSLLEVGIFGCPVFSALDADVAGEIELNFAKNNYYVFSNARNYRYDPTVPILIPYVNSNHLDVIPLQQKSKGFDSGYIITNANCSSTGLVVVLKPLMDRYGIDKLFVTTLQAISGAGYPGVPSLDITDNVFPFISGEETKMEMEPQKILGDLDLNNKNNPFVPKDFKVSATCNRVNVVDGHTECVSIKFKCSPSPTVEEVIQTLENYQSEAQTLKLFSAAPEPLIVFNNDTRPQPKLDRDTYGGMAVTVGRIRPCPLFDIKLTLVSHNTVIGAAGGSILNAELAHAKGFLPQKKIVTRS